MRYTPSEFPLPSGLTLRGFSYIPANEMTAKSNSVVLCLHGWLDNAASFLPLWDDLFVASQKTQIKNRGTKTTTETELASQASHQATIAERNLDSYTWHSIDFPGHGLSEHRSSDAAYHHTDYIMDIAALIETQGWENVILVGHSMGGIVGASVCALLPERIQRFISIEAVGPLVEDSTMTVQQMRRAFRSRIEQAQKTIKQPDSLSRVLSAKMHAGKLSEEHATMIMRRNLRETEGRYVWGTDPKLRTVSTFRMTVAQAKDIMQNIRCPILFIKGDSGFVRISEQYAQRTKWLKTQHSLTTLPGNHYVHMQAPHQLLLAIQNFVTESLT